MATPTPNYNLLKPATGETYDVALLDTNYDKIDTGIHDAYVGTGKPFGHMGRTASFIALNGSTQTVITMDAAQDLKGGMTFDNANDALVVPIIGRYWIHYKAYFTGAASGNSQAQIQVNGATTSGLQQGPSSSHNKMDGNDVYPHGMGILQLNAGDKVSISQMATCSAWGTNGYDGTFLEVQYLGV
jgi:hypothetical protein